jgi:hypothetical protein
MTWKCSRGAMLCLVAGLAVTVSLAACGSSQDNSPAPTPTPTPLSVSTSSLPGGQVGANYSVTLTAAGGTSPYHWVLASDALPPGLALAASGAITGTPSAAANSAAIGLQVTDSESPAQSSARTLSLTIAPSALVVTTQSLPTGEVGVAYTATVSSSGGTPP